MGLFPVNAHMHTVLGCMQVRVYILPQLIYHANYTQNLVSLPGERSRFYHGD